MEQEFTKGIGFRLNKEEIDLDDKLRRELDMSQREVYVYGLTELNKKINLKSVDTE